MSPSSSSEVPVEKVDEVLLKILRVKVVDQRSHLFRPQPTSEREPNTRPNVLGIDAPNTEMSEGLNLLTRDRLRPLNSVANSLHCIRRRRQLRPRDRVIRRVSKYLHARVARTSVVGCQHIFGLQLARLQSRVLGLLTLLRSLASWAIRRPRASGAVRASQHSVVLVSSAVRSHRRRHRRRRLQGRLARDSVRLSEFCVCVRLWL